MSVGEILMKHNLTKVAYLAKKIGIMRDLVEGGEFCRSRSNLKA